MENLAEDSPHFCWDSSDSLFVDLPLGSPVFSLTDVDRHICKVWNRYCSFIILNWLILLLTYMSTALDSVICLQAAEAQKICHNNESKRTIM